MVINGMSGTNTQAGQMGMSQTTDAYSRNIQNQIVNAQKQLQELSSDEESCGRRNLPGKKRQKKQKREKRQKQKKRQRKPGQKRKPKDSRRRMDPMWTSAYKGNNVKRSQEDRMLRSTKSVLSSLTFTDHFIRDNQPSSISRQVMQRGCTQLPLLI